MYGPYEDEESARRAYREMLDELYGVGVLDVGDGQAWDASRVMEAMNPADFEAGFEDFCDGLDDK